MRLAIFAYSRQGCRTARKVISCFPDTEYKAHTMERFAEEGFLPITPPTESLYRELFTWADALIFIASCGIAIRAIAPYVRDKKTDPAIVCIDELGHFVIPLLSGHIGGANELALRIAKRLGADPVITTATDINKKFSVDSWASKKGFLIDNMQEAKAISAAILERKVPICSDFPVTTDYPNGLIPGNSGDLGIYISWKLKTPFKQTLRLIPKCLHLGIGCRKGTNDKTILHAIEKVFNENRMDLRAIKQLVSIDLKANEEGLLKCCKDNGWKPVFYSAEELMDVPGNFTSSVFVQSITGVDNVCERAALAGAEKLLVKKTALRGVTVAVAVENLEVCFG